MHNFNSETMNHPPLLSTTAGASSSFQRIPPRCSFSEYTSTATMMMTEEVEQQHHPSAGFRSLSRSWHHRCDEKENSRNGTIATGQRQRIHLSRTHSHASALRYFRASHKSIFQEESLCQPPNRRLEPRRILSSTSSLSSSKPLIHQKCGPAKSFLTTPQSFLGSSNNSVVVHQPPSTFRSPSKAMHNELVPVAMERFQKRQATRIQATFRGYYCRSRIVRFQPRTTVLHDFRHHRRNGTATSEITMSDFGGDSFASLGSLSLSPQGLYDTFGLEEYYEDDDYLGDEDLEDDGDLLDCFQPNEAPSFSSLFSVKSSADVPARLPARKITPTKLSSNRLVSRTPPRPKPVTFQDETRSDLLLASLPIMPNITARESIESLPLLRPRINSSTFSCHEAMTSERGHSSFSSFFARGDTPMQCPKRCKSPPHGGDVSSHETSGGEERSSSTISSTRQAQEVSPPRARGYTR